MRKTSLKRGTSQLKRSPLKKSGQTKVKKVARQKAFYSSAAWKRLRKEALERAGGECEHEWLLIDPLKRIAPHMHRCDETQGLQVHHKKGSLRFGGDELPEDLQVLCEYHHRLVEHRDHPHRQRSR